MQIDITKLLNGYVDNLELSSEVNIPENLLESSLITNLKNVLISGDLSLNEEDNLVLTGTISGIMVLKDDITLEPVEHTFNTNLEEIFEKSKNILDITDILWQNILVEIPSKVRSTDEDINLEGDGWRVISEEQFEQERSKSNNPFANLDELLNTKEDR
jgi:uncharacterized metal-binding protein YceD (DUF177 family)